MTATLLLIRRRLLGPANAAAPGMLVASSPFGGRLAADTERSIQVFSDGVLEVSRPLPARPEATARKVQIEDPKPAAKSAA
ncbi:MAG TPA: hypothetical protein VIY56_08860 [Vicinamibacterales bacterium]